MWRFQGKNKIKVKRCRFLKYGWRKVLHLLRCTQEKTVTWPGIVGHDVIEFYELYTKQGSIHTFWQQQTRFVCINCDRSVARFWSLLTLITVYSLVRNGSYRFNDTTRQKFDRLRAAQDFAEVNKITHCISIYCFEVHFLKVIPC